MRVADPDIVDQEGRTVSLTRVHIPRERGWQNQFHAPSLPRRQPRKHCPERLRKLLPGRKDFLDALDDEHFDRAGHGHLHQHRRQIVDQLAQTPETAASLASRQLATRMEFSIRTLLHFSRSLRDAPVLTQYHYVTDHRIYAAQDELQLLHQLYCGCYRQADFVRRGSSAQVTSDRASRFKNCLNGVFNTFGCLDLSQMT